MLNTFKSGDFVRENRQTAPIEMVLSQTDDMVRTTAGFRHATKLVQVQNPGRSPAARGEFAAQFEGACAV